LAARKSVKRRGRPEPAFQSRFVLIACLCGATGSARPC